MAVVVVVAAAVVVVVDVITVIVWMPVCWLITLNWSNVSMFADTKSQETIILPSTPPPPLSHVGLV